MSDLVESSADAGRPCWQCGDPLGEFYVLVGELPQIPGVGLRTCVGCAAQLECAR